MVSTKTNTYVIFNGVIYSGCNLSDCLKNFRESKGLTGRETMADLKLLTTATK